MTCDADSSRVYVGDELSEENTTSGHRIKRSPGTCMTTVDPLVGFAVEFILHSDDMALGSAHDHEVGEVHILTHPISDVIGKDFRRRAIEVCRRIVHVWQSRESSLT
jgi:hypothetical protein